MLALRALLDRANTCKAAGEAFFVSDGVAQPCFDFSEMLAAAGCPVAAADATVIPLAALQAAASVGEWAYRLFTLGYGQPALRRDSILIGACVGISARRGAGWGTCLLLIRLRLFGGLWSGRW